MIRDAYEKGYGDAIMPVIPPGAEISPHSRISPAAVGKIPGTWTKEGWVGLNLTKRPPMSLGQAEDYEKLGSSFGLAADRFPGIDIDVDDPKLTVDLISTFFKLLGEGPVRYSKPGRGLIVYASGVPLPRIRLTLTRDDEDYAVELLGKDRQYVIQGKHPSGQEYGFTPKHDLVPVEELVTIDKDQVIGAFQQIQTALEERGWTCDIHVEGAREERELVDQADLKAPDAKALAQVVKQIPNRYDDRADWIRVGHGIKAASQDFPEIGFQIWEWWSNQWEGGNEPEEIARNWDRMKSPFEVGYDYLVGLAGEKERLAQDWFEPDPEAVPEDDPEPLFVDSEAAFGTDRWALDQIQDALAGYLIYNPHRGVWMIWNGFRWEPDDDDRSLDVIGNLLQAMGLRLLERADMMSDKEGKSLRAAAIKYQNTTGIRNVKTLAESRLGVSNGAFDADPMKLNTPAGVVDLVSGEVSPPSPEVLVSRSTTVAPAGRYDPTRAPLWEGFVQDLAGGDPAMVRFFQDLCGYCLTGDVSEKSLYYVWGANSDTGKSTFIRILQDIMGSYSDTVPVKSVIGGGGGDIPADIAKIAGARLVTATEPSANQSWNEERVKAMTGGDLISARFLHQNFFEYYPTYKIVIVGNHEPNIETADDAMLRRVKIVPANHKVPRSKQIADLSSRVLEEEGEQVLRWMIDGCLRWTRDGLKLPSAVQDATDAYAEDESILDRFVEEQCVVEDGAFVSRAKLYEAWRNFCYARGEEPGPEKGFKRTFGPKAADLGLSNHRDFEEGQQRRGYQGIKLLEHNNTTFKPGG